MLWEWKEVAIGWERYRVEGRRATSAHAEAPRASHLHGRCGCGRVGFGGWSVYCNWLVAGAVADCDVFNAAAKLHRHGCRGMWLGGAGFIHLAPGTSCFVRRRDQLEVIGVSGVAVRLSVLGAPQKCGIAHWDGDKRVSDESFVFVERTEFLSRCSVGCKEWSASVVVALDAVVVMASRRTDSVSDVVDVYVPFLIDGGGGHAMTATALVNDC
ncbi:unnamed protein product [Hydatigera taeniaeformis]|uniref:Uncharacterized protein n=1 Tax=Hydatigena taeniaeformis TaxID=6205 RepID=A0A0R3WMS7_HYDTA|nr:unnamed protein product [Hydatigera taeniaeformis]